MQSSLQQQIQQRKKIIKYQTWIKFFRFNSFYRFQEYSSFRERIANSYLHDPAQIERLINFCENLSFQKMEQELDSYIANLISMPYNIQQKVYSYIEYAKKEYIRITKFEKNVVKNHVYMINDLFNHISLLLNNLSQFKQNSRTYLNQQKPPKKRNINSINNLYYHKDITESEELNSDHKIINSSEKIQQSFAIQNHDSIKLLNKLKQKREKTFLRRIEYKKNERVSKEYAFCTSLFFRIIHFIQKMYLLLRKSQVSDLCIKEIFYVFLQTDKTFPQMLDDFQLCMQNYFSSNPAFYLNIETKLYNLLNSSRLLMKQHIQNEGKIIIYFSLTVQILKQICKNDLYILSYIFCKKIQKIINIIPYSVKNTDYFDRLMLKFYYYKGFCQINFDENHKFKDYITCKQFFYRLLYKDYQTFDLRCNLNFDDEGTDKDNFVIFRNEIKKKKYFKIKKQMKNRNAKKILERSKQEFFSQFFLCYIFFRQDSGFFDIDLKKRLLQESLRIFQINPKFDLGIGQICKSYPFQNELSKSQTLKAIRNIMFKEKMNPKVDNSKKTIYENYNQVNPDQILKKLQQDSKNKASVIKYLKLLGDIHIFSGNVTCFLNIWRYLSLLDSSLYTRFILYHDQLRQFNNFYESQGKKIKSQQGFLLNNNDRSLYAQLSNEVDNDIKQLLEQQKVQKISKIQQRVYEEKIMFWRLTYINQKKSFEEGSIEYLNINLGQDNPIICMRKLMNNLLLEIQQSENNNEDIFSTLFQVNYKYFNDKLQEKLQEIKKQSCNADQNIQYTKTFTFNGHQVFLKVFTLQKSQNQGQIYKFNAELMQCVQEVAIGIYLRKKQQQKGQTFQQNIGYHTFVRYIYHFIQDGKLFLILEYYPLLWDNIFKSHFSLGETTIDENLLTKLDSKNKMPASTQSHSISISSIKSYEILGIDNTQVNTLNRNKLYNKTFTLTQSKMKDYSLQFQLQSRTNKGFTQSLENQEFLKTNLMDNTSDPEFIFSNEKQNQQESSYQTIQNNISNTNNIGQSPELIQQEQQETFDITFSSFQESESISQSQKSRINLRDSKVNQTETNTQSLIIKNKSGLRFEPSQQIQFNSLDLFVCLLRLEQAFNLLVQNNILHKDIKLDNIVFRDTDEPIIIDFGISELYLDFSYYMSNAGTLRYMSYQQKICQPLNENTDLTSLIITKYELIIGRKIFIPYQEDKARYITQNASKELKHMFSQDFINLIVMVVDCQLDTIKARAKFFMWLKFEIFMNLVYQCLENTEIGKYTYQQFYSKLKNIIIKRVVCKQKCKLTMQFNLNKLKDLSKNKVFSMLVSLQSHDILKMYESLLYLEIHKYYMEQYYHVKQISKSKSFVNQNKSNIGSNFSLIDLRIKNDEKIKNSDFYDSHSSNESNFKNNASVKQSNSNDFNQKDTILLKSLIINEIYFSLDDQYQIPNYDEFEKDIFSKLDSKCLIHFLYKKKYYINIEKLIICYDNFDQRKLENQQQKLVTSIFLRFLKAAYHQCTISNLTTIMEDTQKQIFLFQEITNKQIQRAYLHTDEIRKEIKNKLKRLQSQNEIEMNKKNLNEQGQISLQIQESQFKNQNINNNQELVFNYNKNNDLTERTFKDILFIINNNNK